MLRVADYIACHLASFGINKAFGMPGGEVLTLLDALKNQSIDFFLVKHENAGGYMAQAVYQRSQTPAILVSTLGPGISNATNVIASAWQDRIPLIVLSGALDGTDKVSYQHQIMDHVSMLERICKISCVLENCESENDVVSQIDKLVHTALDDRRGPVHMDIPVRLAAKMVPASTSSRVRGSADKPLKTAPFLDDTLVEIKQWLKEAKKPLVILGNDILCEGSASEIRDLVEKLQIPTLSTYQAKGILSDKSPLYIGCFSLSPLADKYLRPLVEQADFVLLVGFDPIEVRADWKDVWHPSKQKVIGLSLAANFHYHHFESRNYICHMASGLSVLADGLEGCGQRTWQKNEPQTIRQELAVAFGQNHDWGVGAIVHIIREQLPPNTILSLDTGAHKIVANQVWQTFEPQTVLQSQGLGSMACGLPLAIGATLAERGRLSCALTGDAGFLMCLGELATLKDLNLKIIIVVFVDNSLALIYAKQRRMQLACYGVNFEGGYDYVKIAEAFGGTGTNARNKQELTHALEQAKNSKTFSVIACHVDKAKYKELL